MIKFTNHLALLTISTGLILLINCSDSGEPLGNISVTLEASDAFQSDNPDQSTTNVIWGCVVLDERTSACLYYYNGELQIDGKLSGDAAAAGPGTDGFTFVSPGTTFSALEGGPRTYAHFLGIYSNNTGEPIGTPVDLSGELDLYANEGEDVAWEVNFGTGSPPSVNSQ